MSHPILENHSNHQIGAISEQLLAEVVHKIKNSLGGIGGFATLLERDFEPDDPRLRLVQRIEEGVLRLNDFAVHLMTLVRMDDPEAEDVRLIGLVRQIWENFVFEQGDLFAHDSVQCIPNDKTIIFPGDSQLLRHLIYHAIRFVSIMGTKILAVDLTETDVKQCLFMLKFESDLIDSQNCQVKEMVMQSIPVEAKLSLAIVIKMTEYYHGKIEITMEDDINKMMIYLKKGE